MKITSKEPFAQNGFFVLQDNTFLNNQRIAGKIAAKTLKHLESIILSKTDCTTMQLNNIAEQIIADNGGIPTFKGYKNFPASLCCSVNNQLVHGIPSDYKLQDGDMVSIDLGVTYNNAIADTALTCIYGSPKQDWHVKLISAANEALYKGINAISIGQHIGVIGNAIYKSVKGNGFNVITKYGGHGISTDSNGIGVLHAQPFIDNKADSEVGIRIQPGFSFALEPMLVNGLTDTYTATDGWTIMSRGISAHVEHTVFIHPDRVEIITERDNL
jgi:methionyl aminopeptidase